MTCIVALQQDGKVYVGGDAAATDAWSLTQMSCSQAKLYEKAELLIGSAGSPRVAQIIRYATEFPRCHPDVDGYQFIVTSVVECIRNTLKAYGAVQIDQGVESMESHLLIAFRDRFYEIDGRFAVLQSDKPYAAIGSGASLSYGSFHSSGGETDPRRRVLMSLEAAAAFNAGVRGPFTIKAFGEDAIVTAAA
ncbi:hypothetical protein ACCS79_03675 [Rhizobium johnstonii]|uniref:hypothetical protein n=1 Tax=Rhizobium johnstonii TaxID=3019933 RepID=UPI003F9D5B98